MKLTATYDTPLLTALEGLGPHDHQSLIYESQEDRFAVAVPFIRIGLDRGEKCIYIADDGMEPVVRDAMSAQGIDVARARRDRVVALKPTWTRALDGVREPADACAGPPQLFRTVPVQSPAAAAG